MSRFEARFTTSILTSEILICVYICFSVCISVSPSLFICLSLLLLTRSIYVCKSISLSPTFNALCLYVKFCLSHRLGTTLLVIHYALICLFGWCLLLFGL